MISMRAADCKKKGLFNIAVALYNSAWFGILGEQKAITGLFHKGEWMRIGMLSWESLYSVKVGGVAPHVSELSEALAKGGHEVHVFTRRGEFDGYDKINGVHYHRVDYDQSGDIITQMDRMSDAMVDSFARAQKIFGRFDVAHGHDWHPVNACNRIKRDLGVPYILTIHSTEWGRNGNHASDWGGSKEISYREWLGGYESSQIVVTTQRMKDELKWIYSIPDWKIWIIPNGIVKGKMCRSIDPGRIKERYGIHPLAPVILFCGRMSVQKGPDLLVEAIPHVLRHRPDAHFIFIGEGDMRTDCERRVRDLHVDGSCHFLGYTTSSAKEELVNAADMVCMPSRNEPFGVVVLEAWDAGKPVVATESVSIIKNFEDGILAYIQPESIAWCINHLFESPPDMHRMGYMGQKRIEAEFSWDTIAKRTEQVYRKAMEQAGQGGS
jgi:glycosyltransferase involved in cell wall biosynthesis